MAARRTPSKYARELSRTQTGTLVERTFGPPSPRSARANRAMRLGIFPAVAAWRPTPRGIRLARRIFDPGVTMPALRGSVFQGRRIGGARVEWSTAPRARQEPGDRIVLYLHGGGFVVGSPRTHRNLVSRLSHVLASPVVSVDYRMVPEASIQASRSDALAVYRALLESGHPGRSIIVAGDSAGGNLAAYVALAAREAGLPAPGALILLSPWLDLMEGGPSRRENLPTEFFIGGAVLDRIARVLVPDAGERALWQNSPVNAAPEQLAALPPTLIQIGAHEVLADDGIEMARRMGAAGGRVELQVFEGQGHVVPLWAGNPEARRALREIATWLAAVLDVAHAPEVPDEETLEEAATSGSDADLGPGALPA